MPLPELERLVSVMARLRQECPWDAQQTHRSLVQYLIEETARRSKRLRLESKIIFERSSVICCSR